MKKFLVLFTCSENGKNHQLWKRLSPEERKAHEQKGKEADLAWKEAYKDRIAHEGGPLGDVTKKVDKQGIFDFPSQMGAFLVVFAKSQDEAASMFTDHPHFAHFPGDGVDVIELMDRHA